MMGRFIIIINGEPFPIESDGVQATLDQIKSQSEYTHVTDAEWADYEQGNRTSWPNS